jgi:hypothetical protein
MMIRAENNRGANLTNADAMATFHWRPRQSPSLGSFKGSFLNFLSPFCASYSFQHDYCRWRMKDSVVAEIFALEKCFSPQLPFHPAWLFLLSGHESKVYE